MNDYNDMKELLEMIGEPLAKIMQLMPDASKEECIKSLILRRRLQVWVHSVIYYKFDANIISDAVWSRWAEDLECLQTMYPELADQVEYADVFRNFDHSTGADLPMDNERINNRAAYLLMMAEKRYGR